MPEKASPLFAFWAAPGGRRNPDTARPLLKRNDTRISGDDDVDVKDSNGNPLADGDSVVLIKDLKVKGANVTLKRGTVIKNIHLTADAEEIEGRTDKVKGLVLKTAFVKKA